MPLILQALRNGLTRCASWESEVQLDLCRIQHFRDVLRRKEALICTYRENP